MSLKIILVAEDSDSLARELAVYCQPLGYEVRSSMDARQTLFMVHTSPPELVIFDSDIPVSEALSAHQLMASDRKLRTIPVIMLSERQDDSVKARVEEQGALYVVKTLDPWSSLGPLISELLGIGSEVSSDTSPPLQKPTERKSSTPQPGKAPLILVVDDDRVITQAIDIRLVSNGYRVVCAHNGVEAFAIAKERVPEVITLDVGLPEMDGLGLMQNLVSHPATKDIPVIVLTGYKNESLEKIFSNMGAFSFMTKPFSTGDILNQVKRALEVCGRRGMSSKR